MSAGKPGDAEGAAQRDPALGRSRRAPSLLGLALCPGGLLGAGGGAGGIREELGFQKSISADFHVIGLSVRSYLGGKKVTWLYF